jgi:hypothetical protein
MITAVNLGAERERNYDAVGKPAELIPAADAIADGNIFNWGFSGLPQDFWAQVELELLLSIKHLDVNHKKRVDDLREFIARSNQNSNDNAVFNMGQQE